MPYGLTSTSGSYFSVRFFRSNSLVRLFSKTGQTNYYSN